MGTEREVEVETPGEAAVERDLDARIAGWRRTPPPIPWAAVAKSAPNVAARGYLVLLAAPAVALLGVVAARGLERIALFGTFGLLVALVAALVWHVAATLRRSRRRHAIGLRALLAARRGVVHRRTLRIGPRRLEALVAELGLRRDGDYLEHISIPLPSPRRRDDAPRTPVAPPKC